jgi:hypothetical protein
MNTQNEQPKNDSSHEKPVITFIPENQRNAIAKLDLLHKKHEKLLNDTNINEEEKEESQ